MGEEASVPGPVALVVQEPGDRPHPFGLAEEFIHELPDGRLLLVGDELAVLPGVAVRGAPPSFFPSLARIGTEAATREAISSRSQVAMAAMRV
ncbi:MAG: hypothetical protein QOF89_1109 [Acidobacteriota bacterium]|nr:hypothetical protein [Acidobacteriota bacterium]